MPARLSAFAIWALVAAGVVFWGLRLGSRAMRVPANALTVSHGVEARGDLRRLLGSEPLAIVTPIATPDSGNFQLFGVVAPRQVPSGVKGAVGGVALISVDGKPARAYAVGSQLDGDRVLQSLGRRSATIGPARGAPTVVLELPPPAMPATGRLPTLATGASVSTTSNSEQP